ncbi:Uncharacterised protein [BD1-7 clade bacterium]|uniref:Uncharacterized protein n=1 Tax=BD1-7 clade bacterium TaxID=2029982 RepID=A0A5S9NPC7_9GAMM|nr:Uncharacterised protein [BD1-7 clade bacterium]
MNMDKYFWAATAITTSLALASCGGGGGSNNTSDGKTPTEDKPKDQTTFKFIVETPDFEPVVAANFLQDAIRNTVSIMAPSAVAADNVGFDTIRVAIVSPSGKVTSIITPTSLTQEANGTYSVVLESGERLDCIILVELDDNYDIKVGEFIDPTKSIFTPAVDSRETLEIDLGSTLAYNRFIEGVNGFDNITVEEVEEIIEKARLLLKDNPATASNLTQLIESIEGSIGETVTVLAKFAEATAGNPNAPIQGDSSTIEQDRATIKAFFDDVNTVYQLTGLSEYNTQEDNALNDLRNDGVLTLATIEKSETNIDALSAITEAIIEFIDDQDSLPETAISIPVKNIVSDAFTVEGDLTYSRDTISAVINGAYKGVALRNIEFELDAPDDSLRSTASVTGEIEDSNSKLVINDGRIILDGIILGELLKSIDSDDAETYVDGLRKAQVILNAELTGKNVRNNLDGNFSGQLDIVAVRSDNDFIEFRAEPGEDAEKEAQYNLKSANIDGTFSFDSNTIQVSISATSDNADTYVPPTQEFLPGDSSYDLISYSWNGVDEFILNTPEHSDKYTMSERTLKSLFLSGQDYTNDREIAVPKGAEAPTQLIDFLDPYFYLWTGRYSVRVEKSDLTVGKNQRLNNSDSFPRGMSYDLSENELRFYDDNGVTREKYTLEKIVKIDVSDDQSDYYRADFIRTNPTDVSVPLETGFDEYVLRPGVFDSAYVYTDDFVGEYDIDTSGYDINSENGEVTATLRSSYRNPPEEITFKYSWKDNVFTLSSDTYDFYSKLALENEATYSGKVIEKTRIEGNSETTSIIRNDTYLYRDTSIHRFSRYRIEDLMYGTRIKNIGWVSVLEANLPLAEQDLDHVVIPTSGDDVSILVHASEPVSLREKETPDSYRLANANISVRTELSRFGNTELNASISRTGYDDGIVMLTIESTDNAQLNSAITVSAAAADNNLLALSISNDKGFMISKSQVQSETEEDNQWIITYGKETARINVLNFGLKVTYSNGQFNTY